MVVVLVSPAALPAAVELSLPLPHAVPTMATRAKGAAKRRKVRFMVCSFVSFVRGGPLNYPLYGTAGRSG
jgi:hypothetical protein